MLDPLFVSLELKALFFPFFRSGDFDFENEDFLYRGGETLVPDRMLDRRLSNGFWECMDPREPRNPSGFLAFGNWRERFEPLRVLRRRLFSELREERRPSISAATFSTRERGPASVTTTK